MIKSKSALTTTLYESCCGGEGITKVMEFLAADEVYRKVDTIAYATLSPGDSIGRHTHVDEMEAYIILKGKGLFYDNGIDDM